MRGTRQTKLYIDRACVATSSPASAASSAAGGLANYLETKQITKLVADEPWGW